MVNQNTSFTPLLAEDEKLTPVMIYTSHCMVWGNVFSKKAIRVSSWLHTDVAPTYMKIFNAQLLMVSGSNSPAPVNHDVLHLQTNNIIAFHLMPPADEGVDYDPEEPNRKFVPISAYAGFFRFDGFARMAELTHLEIYIGATKGEYITIYDISMTCPVIPSIKGIKAPLVLLRQERVIFSGKDD